MAGHTQATGWIAGEYLIMADMGEGWFLESTKRIEDKQDAELERDRIDWASGHEARVTFIPVAKAAGAPALYEALEALTRRATGPLTAETTKADPLWEAARAALARARGEAAKS